MCAWSVMGRQFGVVVEFVDEAVGTDPLSGLGGDIRQGTLDTHYYLLKKAMKNQNRLL